MSIFKKLFSRKNKNIPAPKGICPNCWGRQEYQDKIFEAIKKNETDITKLNDKKGWIQAYAMENLPKLWLKDNGGTQSCPTCHLEYKQVEKKK